MKHIDKIIVGSAMLIGLALVTANYTQAEVMTGDKTMGMKEQSTMSTQDTSHLTDIQKKVMFNDGTEPAFKNEYWDNKEPGIYVDLISGDALYSSTDKFKSGTGWPSFTKPIDENAVKELTDKKLFMTRTEIRSAKSDVHLGHVFNDGPKEAGGLRYCMNSAALKFIPLADLEKEGYGEYKSLF